MKLIASDVSLMNISIEEKHAQNKVCPFNDGVCAGDGCMLWINIFTDERKEAIAGCCALSLQGSNNKIHLGFIGSK